MSPQGSIWNPTAETMPREELRALQDELLRAQLARVYERSPMQRERLGAAGISPGRFNGLEDLHSLPTFTKDDVRVWRERTGDTFGGTLCVPLETVATITHSSGTSGDPTVAALTEHDIDVVGEAYARALFSIGVRAGDRSPFAASLFWHGAVVGYDLAHRVLGAQAFRIACGTADGVRTVMERWRDADFTVLRSYIPELEIPYLHEAGIRPLDFFPSARFVYAGIDLSAPKRRLIEEAWGMPFRNTFGSSDQYLIGGECEHSAPFHHVAEDRTIYEIVDPGTGDPLPSGEIGELVVTNLWAEACPYLRYRIEDLAMIVDEPCSCGRTTARVRVLGRAAWSVLVEARRIFSTQVEEALWSEPELLGVSYQLVREGTQPQATLRVRLDRAHRDRVDLADATALLEEAFDVPADVEWTEDAINLRGPIKIERVVTVA